MSSYKCEFRDPKEINELWQLMIQKNSKSHLDTKNSICHLKRHGKLTCNNNRSTKSEINIPPTKVKLGEPIAKSGLRPCESTRIIRSCQIDNEELFKSMTNGKSCELSDDLNGMTKANGTRAPRNVIWIALGYNEDVSSNLPFTFLTTGRHKGFSFN